MTALILAGGQGTRMKSPLPKVLHPVAGKPMIVRAIESCRLAGVDTIRVVVGHGQGLVNSIIEPFSVKSYVQEKQLGTADAVKAADLPTLTGDVLIMNGDHPLIKTEDIKNFFNLFTQHKLDLAVFTVEITEKNDFGRILRKENKLQSIVEVKEASTEILRIAEINTGIYIAKAEVLQKLIPKVKNENAKKEFYLTDIIQLAREAGLRVDAIQYQNSDIAHGVNNQIELAAATEKMYRVNADRLMNNGVVILDPKTTYIEDTVIVGSGSVIYPGVFLRGKTAVGAFTVIEPNCFISDSVLADSVQIKAGSYIEKTIIKTQATVGPYARLRPDTTIGQAAHVGNFVEMKKVNFGAKSKAGHLTYLGDADIGEDVNIGCGTITCNYAADKKKYKTIIGDRVFVGSDTQLVAPVTIGSDSIIASGSTVTKAVPEGALTLSRAPQVNKEGYAKRFKKSDSGK